MTTPQAGSFAQLPPQTLDDRTPGAGKAALRRTRSADRYFRFLCIVLLGYALGGRGFAYWGVNPLFIGEITLLIGVYIAIKTGSLKRVLGIRTFVPLMIFMFWGLCCTVPYLDTYQKDAIRDAVIWGYGTFAFIFATLLLSEPTRLQKLVIYYRKFVVWFLVLAPVSTIISGYFEYMLPPAPLFGGAPLIQVKGGDMCVHLAGAFCYIVALGKGINPWITSLFVPLNLALNVQGRAGMVAFAMAVFITMVLRPFHPRAMRILFVVAVGLFFFWASDIRIEKSGRELSFDFLTKAIQSIYKDSDDDTMRATKEWRVKWWTDIINYTFHGKYFWMGKGFGINLADDDGYQVEDDSALRSPHNGHMTMLARSGVPGFCIWIITQGTFGATMVISYLRARKQRHLNWSGLFMFLGAYWGAFMSNAAFDVFLEGPMGGIWLWCIYGVGVAAARLYKRYPDLLTPTPPTQPAIAPMTA